MLALRLCGQCHITFENDIPHKFLLHSLNGLLHVVYLEIDILFPVVAWHIFILVVGVGH